MAAVLRRRGVLHHTSSEAARNAADGDREPGGPRGRDAAARRFFIRFLLFSPW